MARAHSRERVACGALIAAAGANAAPALSAWSGALRRRLGVQSELADRGEVALTFDDGPHPSGTPAVLEVLAEHEVTATFFLAGEQVERQPGLAARIVDEGHEIALHCHRHRNLLRLTPAQVRCDLARARDAIVQATGIAPRLYRPPYGVLSTSALVRARGLGLRPVLWSRWGRDWSGGATPDTIVTELCQELAGGEILLLHDSDAYSARESWRATAAALPLVLTAIDLAGLRAAPIR